MTIIRTIMLCVLFLSCLIICLTLVWCGILALTTPEQKADPTDAIQRLMLPCVILCALALSGCQSLNYKPVIQDFSCVPTNVTSIIIFSQTLSTEGAQIEKLGYNRGVPQ